MNFQTKIFWDVKLFLVLIPAINIVNYYLTYSGITFSGFTILTFCLDTLEGYAAWLVTRYIISLLDKKMPFENNLPLRIIVQTFSTLIAGMLVIILLTNLVNVIATNSPIPESFYKYDIFIIAIWFFVINGIYISAHFYLEWQHHKIQKNDSAVNKEKLNALFNNGFTVKNGKTDMILLYNEIAGFYMDGEYVTCTTISDKKYLLDQSVEKIESELPLVLFFRLNRQFLLHRQIINGFQRAENGKLNVLTTPLKNITSPISVSRTKAAAFKDWFQAEFENSSTGK
jgi:LytTr DNA-binding domain-containing protein